MALEVNTPAAEVQTPILSAKTVHFPIAVRLYGAREQIQCKPGLAKKLAGVLFQELQEFQAVFKDLFLKNFKDLYR